MTKFGKGLVIAGIAALALTAIGIILMICAPADTSTMMKVGVFSAMYGFMADIVVAKLYGEFKNTDFHKKEGATK